jgi:hypothetical protein
MLESLGLKKSANLHVFESIKKEFDSHLSKQQESETERREEPASSKVQKKEKSIDTSIVKLISGSKISGDNIWIESSQEVSKQP